MIQLASILEDFVNPTLTNTMVEKKKLEDFNFPLLFKICPMVGFNESALKEYGYKSASGYFKGESMFKGSRMVGWGGHKNGSVEPQGSVEEVYAKVKNHEVGDFMDSVKTYFKDGKSKRFTSNSSFVYLKRVNYPYNCFTLNLGNDTDVQANGITDIRFHLNRPKNADTEKIELQNQYG